MPTSNDDKIQCAYEFQQIAGIPDVLGAIDGSYISIRKPKHKIRSTYVNRHHDCSLTLQAICNAKKKFVDVFTGTPGKMHDARILQHSFIYKDAYLQQVCRSKYHILGDAAYPLEENIITPFKDYGNLTNNEKLFNKNHSKTRVVIENTFGLLKGRFRQLLKLDFSLAEKDSNFILACCVLHNLCTDDDYLGPEQPPVEVEELPGNVTLNIHPGTLQSREKGFQKRKMLCTL
ncbi:putative nuclease HARBI1 [Acyrthosiphon pisum]|uniref:DDE Tnp4 domain-containing protein n=1 Tax=Acyrthosiphon pisum TaxID=7029 RepID=A0A8R2JWP7_ACYPI|nr:putative nuclease HARBI1 [Acyrthosiphon pisum]